MSGAPKSKLHPSSTAPWTVRVTELLMDGEWHDYKTVVTLAAPSVPPGPAWRYAEKRRLEEYKKRGTEPQDRVFGDKNSTIRSGQKYYVRAAILNLKRRGTVEVEYDPNPKLKYKKPIRLRLTPAAIAIVENAPDTEEVKRQKDREQRDRHAQSLGYKDYNTYHNERRRLREQQQGGVKSPEDPVSAKALIERVYDDLEQAETYKRERDGR